MKRILYIILWTPPIGWWSEDLNWNINNGLEQDILFSNNTISLWIDCLYYGIYREIFWENIYGAIDNYVKKNNYTVIDIGANRGYASIWFANKKWCEKVIAYELIPENCRKMKRNLEVNKKLKIVLNEFGLGAETKKSKAYFSHLEMQYRQHIKSLLMFMLPIKQIKQI